jgi:imidazolonepropionase-like amidohydrolase
LAIYRADRSGRVLYVDACRLHSRTHASYVKQTMRAEIPTPLFASSLAICIVLAADMSFGPLSAVRADDAALPKTVAFVGASLVDGTGKALQHNSTILVRGARIVAVGPMDDINVPTDAQVVHVDGRFIIPGLINSHVHLATLANPREARAYLRRELYSGVTAVRDMAGDVRLLSELKREAEFDEIIAPDVYYAALMAGPGFFIDARTHDAARGIEPGTAPWMRAITPETPLPLAIAEARGTGATAIKIYADLPPALVSAITTEAHRQHLLVWAHAAVFPAGPLDVARAGVDVMSHADFLAYQLSEHIPQSFETTTPIDPKAWHSQPAMGELLQLMQKRGIILDATVDVGERHPSPKWPAGLAGYIAGQAYRRGVMISAGTDDDPDWSEQDSLLDSEVVRLVSDVGMTPMDAIRSASAIGARTVGELKSMGTIEPGKLANFVILERNPLANIGDIRSVVEVVKHGLQYPRNAYRPVSAQEMKNRASASE